MHSRPIPLLAASLAALLLATGLAQAKEPGIPRGEKSFKRLDVDKDGKLEIDELQPRAKKRFMQLDKDSNDRVTTQEIEAWLNAIMQRRRDRILAKMDKNKDGAITSKELAAHVADQFGLADTDADGGVTLDEARKYHVAKRRKYWADFRKTRKRN